MPLAQARELANDARKTAALGGTPLAPKVQRATAEKKTKTYADVVALYHDAKLTGLRTGDKVRETLDRIGRVYGWNERPLASITDDDAATMLHDIADRRGRKAMANQTKHVLHAMFKWAKQPGRKFVTVNPFADLPAPGGAIVTRDRFLTVAEIRQVWRALDAPERFNVSRRCRDRLAPDPCDGGAARHGRWHGRQRASRPARPERTRSALVAAS